MPRGQNISAGLAMDCPCSRVSYFQKSTGDRHFPELLDEGTAAGHWCSAHRQLRLLGGEVLVEGAARSRARVARQPRRRRLRCRLGGRSRHEWRRLACHRTCLPTHEPASATSPLALHTVVRCIHDAYAVDALFLVTALLILLSQLLFHSHTAADTLATHSHAVSTSMGRASIQAIMSEG